MKRGSSRNKKGASVGILILFIATVLVAAIAAGVIIQTSTSLQSKALTTGSKAKESISSSLYISRIYAEDGSGSSGLTEFYMQIKLSPGSDPIKLNTTLLNLNLVSASTSYTFNETVPSCDAGGVLSGFFNAEYILNGSTHKDNYMNSGDIVLLCFPSTAVNEGELIMFEVVPKFGNKITMDKSLPDVFQAKTIYIHP